LWAGVVTCYLLIVNCYLLPAITILHKRGRDMLKLLEEVPIGTVYAEITLKNAVDVGEFLRGHITVTS
jgi:hypothetical protein